MRFLARTSIAFKIVIRAMSPTTDHDASYRMDLTGVRALLRPHVVALSDTTTHSSLPTMCEKLGLSSSDSQGSKRERMIASFDALSDGDVAPVAERFLELHPPPASVRNELQDAVWALTVSPEIPKRFRRDVARAMAGEDIYLDVHRFSILLDSLFVLDDNPAALFFGGKDRSLRAEIQRHVYRNPEDWSAEDLFERLGAFDASDRRFACFLEGLASSEVRPDEPSQRDFVRIVNEPLRGCGVELRETHTEGGYPVFTVVSTDPARTGRPKNLIFASSVKPDLRFRDAVNNDIEIVTNANRVLVYDRPIGRDGLLWRDLQSWWSETHGITDDNEAKKTLYRRLLESLPKNSPPQTFLFESFYRGFSSAVPGIPALIPEVWLHWDPKTVKERGRDALLRFRMDFLLLLPGGFRVVLEVDGKHHYSRDDGRADTTRYAALAAGDRSLKLAGYQVFRFGAEELQAEAAAPVVKSFFDDLFKRYGVAVPPQ